MVPSLFKMIDLEGLDLAEINGREVPGIYNKIQEAYSTSRVAILCNWFFAGIVITPSYVLITNPAENKFLIDDAILVKSDDTVSVIGIIPDPVLEPLEVAENGTYTPRVGVDGFSSVDVNVPDTPPVLVQLTATENGTYTPDTGVDGFSSVSVAVPSVKVMDNFSVNWDFTNPINTNGQSTYTGNVNAIDGWSVYAATMKIVTGGITVEKTGSSWGGFIQRIKSSLINYFSGKQMTISAIVDGSLVTGSFTFPTSTGGTQAYGISGCTIRIYRQATNIAEITIDAAPTGSPHVISAYKLEFGSTQTLATNVNGIWVVNQNMNVDAEKLKQYILLN